MDDSPERSISSVNAQSPAVQDSPFFHYLNTLSPIKPVKSVHVAQTFSELHFPPPPAVFTSPRVAIQKEANLSKRSCQNDMGENENEMYHGVHTGNEKLSSVNRGTSNCDSTTPLSCAIKEALVSSQTSDKTKTEEKNIVGCSASHHLSVPMEDKNCKDRACKTNAKPLGFMELNNSQGAIACCREAMEDMNIDSQSRDPNEVAAFVDEPSEIVSSQRIAKGSLSMVDALEQSTGNQNVAEEIVLASSDGGSNNANRQMHSNNSNNLEPNSNHAEHFVAHRHDSFTFLLSNDSVCESDTGQKVPHTECSSVMLEQGLKDIASQCEMSSESNHVDSTPQPLHDSFEGTNGCGDLHRKCDNEQTKPTEHQASFTCKSSSQLPRGIRRRCLDFEATGAQNKVMNSSLKVLNSSKASASATISLNTTSLHPVSHQCKEVSEGKQIVARDENGDACEGSPSLTLVPFSSSSSKPANVTRVYMPSGIGLHLNSLATTMPMSSAINISSSAKGPVNTQGLQTLTSSKENLPNSEAISQASVTSGGNPGSSPNVASGMVLSVAENSKLDQQEAESSGMQVGMTKTTTSFRSLTVKPLQCRMPLKSEGSNMSPLGKRSMPHDNSRQSSLSANDETNPGSQGSPKKKRRKSTANSDKEGCKRCNCKKSKCLKLYCECFAAGVYCVEPCTCHECFNKPEYEDMVLGTRQQIESRNPLAFAPKIVCDSNALPNNGDDCGETPASARHKRGCNCKKSMCLKKYCECYQAGVGCSDGCRCDGCKNVFGKKEGGSDEAEDKVNDEACEKDSSDDKGDMHGSGNEALILEQQQINDISPITPSLQSFSQGRVMTKSKFSARKQTLQISAASQSCSKPPRSPGTILRPTKRMHENVTNDTCRNLGPRPSVPSIFSPETEKSRRFSPKWDGLSDICSVTPQLHRPLRMANASNSDATDASPINGQSIEVSSVESRSSASSNQKNESLPLVSQDSATRSPLCLSGKNVWQNSPSAYGSPLTPSLNNTGCNAGTKGVTVAMADFDTRSNDAASSAEDDTPEFLTNTCSPTRGLKANSPNQKRVSPPHHCYGKEINRSLLSSPGLKSGRKFILQSVPSFPTLKPCEDQDKD